MDLCGLKEIFYRIYNSVSQLLHWVLVHLTDLTAGVLAHFLFRRHFHFLLSVLVMLFLHSCWGWTCILCGSFIFLLSYCISNSFIHSVRHLFRLAVTGTLWTLFRRLLSFLVDASGSCFEPLQNPTDVQEKGKAACLKAGLQWQGCEVSDDILILSLCCLILAEEIGVFRPCMALGKPVGTPLRILFLLCVLLMSLWIFLIVCLLAHFPLFPSQLVGGALGYLGWKGLYYKGWCVLKPGWCCVGRPKYSFKKIKKVHILN
uniref:Fat storage-inducing transmembrane protein 1 n=1 Tax=Cyprinus carpio TaxID=7962 RepID=A0A8C1GYT7_CYPCA